MNNETTHDRVPLPSTETASHAPPVHPLPERIGHYHIKRVIASGGMGTVYEAVQESPRRVVAVKVMKQGIASRSALRRFEYESQILARLRHPGIAQIFEAGTHEDPATPGVAVPYFAMEYIPNAKPITKYAEDKKLGTRQRMELFAKVCDAVHHGHQKGVIHRDLKPSNILVTSPLDSSPTKGGSGGVGEVKIIDFGVARSTDSDMAVTTLQTDVGQLIGTLQYMSPEQCEADPHDIDTRSDVYALGVVFYQLLCGLLPYDLTRAAIHNATRIIREQQPTKLSAVDRALRGDVETVALKALEKERDRRYQSAADFGQDIQRYLLNQPIQARPQSMIYHLRKFARRRRIPLATAAAVLLALGFAIDRQIRFAWSRSMQETLDTAYAVLYAGQSKEALSHTNQGQVIADCTRLIANHPSLAAAYALRAKAYNLRGAGSDNDSAWRDCNKALELDRENTLAQRTLGLLYYKRGELENAREAFERGFNNIVFGEDLPRDFHNRALVHSDLGDYEGALPFLDAAVALAPRKSDVYLNRSLTRRFTGNIDGAIEDCGRGVSLEPDRWTVQCGLWTWEMLMFRNGGGDKEAAEAALANAEQAAIKPLEKDVVAVCRGTSEGQTALSEAKTPELQCGAYYYLGAKALVDHRLEEAAVLFKMSQDTQEHGLPEYNLAHWHLARLEKP